MNNQLIIISGIVGFIVLGGFTYWKFFDVDPQLPSGYLPPGYPQQGYVTQQTKMGGGAEHGLGLD